MRLSYAREKRELCDNDGRLCSAVQEMKGLLLLQPPNIACPDGLFATRGPPTPAPSSARSERRGHTAAELILGFKIVGALQVSNPMTVPFPPNEKETWVQTPSRLSPRERRATRSAPDLTSADDP